MSLAPLPHLQLYNYLKSWDSGSYAKRDEMVEKFIADYGKCIDPLDLEHLLNNGGTLIFTRFVVGMQICVAKRRRVARYFNALEIFVRSLHGEKYIIEFISMGAANTTFEVLGIDEMNNDGSSGFVRFREYICSEPSYLSSVVDCLITCKDEDVINSARIFFENMCVGNTMRNINIISKYVIALLPCDFNPKVQSCACAILPKIVDQNPEIAAQCYNSVVEALKTDYNDMLVEIGELCIAMMKTSIAPGLIQALIEVAIPENINEHLESPYTYHGFQRVNVIQPSIISGDQTVRGFLSRSTTTNTNTTARPNDENQSSGGEKDNPRSAYITLYRMQLGSLFVLSFILKNRPEFADWMVNEGYIGCLIAAIGSSPFCHVQLSGVRSLMLTYELSSDCKLALPHLLPQNLLELILTEGEACLRYLTAPMCVLLRKIGRIVQKNWSEWFDTTVLNARTQSQVQIAGSGTETEPGSSDDQQQTTTTGDINVKLDGDGKSENNDSTAADDWEDQNDGDDDNDSDRDSELGSVDSMMNLTVSQKVQVYLCELMELFVPGIRPLVETMYPYDIGEDLLNKIESHLAGTAAAGLNNPSGGNNNRSIGEVQIMENDHFEGFRKYLLLHTDVLNEEMDEFERYFESRIPYANIELELGGKELVLLEEAQKQLEKMKNLGSTLELPDLNPGGEIIIDDEEPTKDGLMSTWTKIPAIQKASHDTSVTNSEQTLILLKSNKK